MSPCSHKHICSVPCTFSSGNTPSDPQTEKTALGRQMQPLASYRVIRELESQSHSTLLTNVPGWKSGLQLVTVTTKTQHSTAPISGINTVTMAENRKHKSPSAGECEKLWYIHTVENNSARNREEPLTPATCHLRGLVNAAWQVEKAQIRGSNTLRCHFMTFWRRPDQRTGEEVGGCLRL